MSQQPINHPDGTCDWTIRNTTEDKASAVEKLDELIASEIDLDEAAFGGKGVDEARQGILRLAKDHLELFHRLKGLASDLAQILRCIDLPGKTDDQVFADFVAAAATAELNVSLLVLFQFYIEACNAIDDADGSDADQSSDEETNRSVERSKEGTS